MISTMGRDTRSSEGPRGTTEYNGVQRSTPDYNVKAYPDLARDLLALLDLMRLELCDRQRLSAASLPADSTTPGASAA